MPALRLIVDFDGVVCDAMEECALVTWLGAHPPSPGSPVSSYLTAMPRGFVQRFRNIRGFARLLEHFLVAHRPAAAYIQTRARFDTVFRCIAAEYVREFTRTANAARQRCRVEEPAFWLGLHTMYPGIPEMLRDMAGTVAVVTAKDEQSVRAILERHGLAGTVAEIIGECGQKAEAVRDLCARHGITPDAVTFVDDNLANVVAVAATGAAAYWAMWGYHTSDDLAEASRTGVRRLELAEMPALTAA
jgi:phosphoglycolate phosphatase-like HAD superfamily hydrolase